MKAIIDKLSSKIGWLPAVPQAARAVVVVGLALGNETDVAESLEQSVL